MIYPMSNFIRWALCPSLSDSEAYSFQCTIRDSNIQRILNPEPFITQGFIHKNLQFLDINAYWLNNESIK